MKLQEVFQAYKNCIMPTYTKVPLVFVKGKGSLLWDMNNKVYLDFFPGWGVGNLGHCHPKVMQAIRDQVSKLMFIPNNYYHIPQAKLAKELVSLSYPAKVFFCNSGAEANEAAIKLSRKFGASTALSTDGERPFDKFGVVPSETEGQGRTIGQGRYEIITFENSFHGRTLATLAATGQKKYQNGFEPLPQGFRTIAFNNLDEVKKAVTEKTVGVMLELVQGEGGVNVAEKAFVSGLRKLCDEKKLLLIFDEVQTGIGRTGKLFCYEHYGVFPDIMTLAKALGAGLPIGITVVKKEIADLLGPGMHASTFGGGPVVCRAALAVLKAIQKDKLLRNSQEMGGYLFKKLNELKARYGIIKEVRGLGLMAGIELNVEGRPIVEECINKGLLINCTHDKVLRLMPVLNVSKKDIDKALSVLDSAIRNYAY